MSLLHCKRTLSAANFSPFLSRVSSRHFSSQKKNNYDLNVFVSNSHSPYFNLSFEDYLFKKYQSYTSSDNSQIYSKYLLLYTNSPCVVIGRNQNPYRETVVSALRAHSIPLIRRKSGGGAVFHDLGNVNYCVMMPNSHFDRDEHALAICEALQNQAQLSINERHDIINADGKKVSGSAYKLQRGKAYHHGTMLLNSELHVLSELLHSKSAFSNLQTVDGPGVQSVKSPVANVGVTNDEFISSAIKLFREKYTDGKEQSFKLRYLNESTLLPDEAAEVNSRMDELKVFFF